jgi:hypothetical protein
VFFRFKFVSNLKVQWNFSWLERTDLYYLAFPEDRVHMKCLVYGIYFLEFIQSVLIVETTFRKFVTNFQDTGVFDRVETAWLSIPIITAIGKFFFKRRRCWDSNIPPRYILRPRVLCIPDQHFGKIEESCGSNHCCKSSKELHNHSGHPRSEIGKILWPHSFLSFNSAVGLQSGFTKKLYSLLFTPDILSSTGVRTTSSRFPSQ